MSGCRYVNVCISYICICPLYLKVLSECVMAITVVCVCVYVVCICRSVVAGDKLFFMSVFFLWRQQLWRIFCFTLKLVLALNGVEDEVVECLCVYV